MLHLTDAKKIFTNYAVIAPALIFALGSLACAPNDNPKDASHIIVGMEATPVNSLIYIAGDQGYFKNNGLDVTIKDNYPSGAAASDDIMKGKVDFSTTAELYIVRQAFAGENIVNLANIANFMHMKMLVRKDHGIQDVSDLEGKRIGVPLTTAADFMLGRFLDLNGIHPDDVIIVEVQAPEAVDAFINGKIDALVTWQPNVIAIQEQMGDSVSIWDVQSGQPLHCVLLASGDWARTHPDLDERFLRAIVQAEDFVSHNPEKAKSIIQTILGYDDAHIDAMWPDYQFYVQLDQSLITAMEDQSRWIIANGLTTEKQVPDFLDYIYEDPLREVTPGAITVIR